MPHGWQRLAILLWGRCAFEPETHRKPFIGNAPPHVWRRSAENAGRDCLAQNGEAGRLKSALHAPVKVAAQDADLAAGELRRCIGSDHGGMCRIEFGWVLDALITDT